MKKSIYLLGLLSISLTLLQCGDREFWRYFIRGSLLTSIQDAQTMLTLEGRPRSAYCFDKDLDGDQDILVICDNDLIFDFTNLVGGRFGTPAPAYVVEDTPQRMAIADFNGDQLLDIAVTNQLSDDIALLFNTHTGDFTSITYIEAGMEPFPILAEDFDRDRRPDLAVANMGGNTVLFYKNVNNSELKIMKEKKVGEMPFGLASSDLDKNGYPDLLCINYDSNDLSVFKNSGDFYFAEEEIYAIPGNPSALTTLDFNGDHFYDVAVTQFNLDSMTVLLNNGKGEFEQALTFATGTSPIAILAMDFDLNGWEDLVVANKDEDSLSFFMNSPDFLDQFKYALPEGFQTNFISIGLLNENAFYDFVLCDFDHRRLLILFDVFAPQSL